MRRGMQSNGRRRGRQCHVWQAMMRQWNFDFLFAGRLTLDGMFQLRMSQLRMSQLPMFQLRMSLLRMFLLRMFLLGVFLLLIFLLRTDGVWHVRGLGRRKLTLLRRWLR